MYAAGYREAKKREKYVHRCPSATDINRTKTSCALSLVLHVRITSFGSIVRSFHFVFSQTTIFLLSFRTIGTDHRFVKLVESVSERKIKIKRKKRASH